MMGKILLWKLLYSSVFIISIWILYKSHKDRRSEDLIIGLFIMAISIFLMHFPLSYKHKWLEN